MRRLLALAVAAERPGARTQREPSMPLATPVLVALGVGLSAAAFTGLVAALAARRLGRLGAIDLGLASAGEARWPPGRR